MLIGPASKDHGRLLDVIDSLRSQGIDRHVPLPQLIVCGDQSSGKSSVLEAVSGARFPTKDTLCTRFATELILRRGPVTRLAINIRPSQQRSNEEKKSLEQFEAPTNDIDGLPDMVEAAKEAMGIKSESKAFCEDILRIEVSGPNQPHLTLVDLPGLFHSPGSKQSDEDSELVKSLVRSYMASERSIILAVVTASNEYVNQIVTSFTRQVDPRGARTLGIITKPDLLIAGSNSERIFLNLAKNEEVSFRLGWHVLRNRDFNTKDASSDERDREETEFFSRGIWTALPAQFLGIAALKPRLSTILREQIISVLPRLIQDVEKGIEDSQGRLNRLGEARETILEQRLYLVRVGQTFSHLIKAAVDGVYPPDFFGDAMTAEGYSKRLRAVVQNLLLDFAEEMNINGQEQTIIEDDEGHKARPEKSEIARSSYIDNVLELMRRTRGRELPGTFNPLIIGDLFYQQSKPWKSIVEHHSVKIIDAARVTLEMAIVAAADVKTSKELLHELLYPGLNKYSLTLHHKVEEILRPHRQGHPITYNHYFTETVQKAREARDRKRQARQLNIFFKKLPEAVEPYISSPMPFSTKDLLNALNQPAEADMDRHACSEAVDCLEAYYKVAMKTFVDNFSVLAVESCVIGDIANCLSPENVMKLDDTLINSIAAETEESQIERRRTTEKLRTLNEGMLILSRFSQHRLTDPNESESEEEIGEDVSEVVNQEEDQPPPLEERLIDAKVSEENLMKPENPTGKSEDGFWGTGTVMPSAIKKKHKKKLWFDETHG